MTTEKKVLLILTIFTLMLLGGGVFLISNSTAGPAQVTASQNAKVSVEQKIYDFGQAPYQGGNVIHDFIIKNTGTDVLKLMNIKTSCHCTKAQVNINGNASPLFGMSGVSSYIGEVVPGKEAKLTVIFDPLYHGLQGIGPVNRLVSVETNDAQNLKLEFSLTGTVVK